MTSTVALYVLRQVMMGVLLALGVIMTVIILVDVVELSRTLGDRASVSALTLAWLALLRAPNLAQTTLPFVFLFGVMWGMYRLNRRSELVVMRAAGLSAWRFIGPGVGLALLSGIVATTLINPAAARMQQAFEDERERIILGSRIVQSARSDTRTIWMRERRERQQTVIRAQSADTQQQRLNSVTFFIYDLNRDGLPSFSRRLDAEYAVLRQGFWELNAAWEVAPDREPLFEASTSLVTEIDGRTLMESQGVRGALNFWDLPNQSRLLREAGFSSIEYELEWHRLLALPLTLAAMTLVASAACLRLSRRGGALQLTFTAAAVGFAVYFGDSMLAALGSTSVLPTILAAWSAPLLTFLGGLFVIATLEDG